MFVINDTTGKISPQFPPRKVLVKEININMTNK